MVDLRPLALGNQHFRKALERLDGRGRVLLSDVREDCPIQPLCVRLVRHRQHLARQHDAPESQQANQRHAREHFVETSHTALLTVFAPRSESSLYQKEGEAEV
jgi:hypothetical protein